MPGALVFSCLSHDILAHEVTHAILDGLHPKYNVASNPDVLAFHEAFADIVALFQHFTFPDVLKHQIARTRGELDKQNLLGELAQQVGVAIGKYGSLRSAIGTRSDKGDWVSATPDPTDYLETMEPHDRGSILVAAVFEAFLTMYKGRIKDLLRIASGGSGVLKEGELQQDLVNRLAAEAATTASHVLNMCVRALDYCPPVDITFGDFLRAIITADYDLVADDRHHYRLAFIDAFRRRGIYPDGIRTLSEESLRYRDEWHNLPTQEREVLSVLADFLRDYRSSVIYETDRKALFETSQFFVGGGAGVQGLHQRLKRKLDYSLAFEKLTGVVYDREWKDFGVNALTDTKGPTFQVLNLRLATRVGPDGTQSNQIVFGLVQRIGVVLDAGKITGCYSPGLAKTPPSGGFVVYGGCTLIFDLDSLSLKYAISKPLLNPDSLDRNKHELNLERIQRQHHYQSEELPMAIPEVAKYFASGTDGAFDEPFALLHPM